MVHKKKYSGKILMLQESCFPGDVRPRNEAHALIKAGYKVTVIALSGKGEKIKEDMDGIQVYRIPKLTLFKKTFEPNTSYLQKLFSRAKSVTGYLYEYFYFTSACLLLSFYILLKEGFDVIHAHNPPDSLFIIGGFYKIFGKKFIFDHHDLSPELYMTRFSGKNDFIYKLLILFEKLSCKMANVIISTNESYKEIEIKRHSINPKKIYIVRNNPIISDCLLEKINSDNKEEKKDKKVLLFLGSINPQDGVETLLRILHFLVNNLNKKDFICNIIGDGDSLQTVKQMAKELNLMEYIDFKGVVFDREKIKEYLYLADVCIEPAPDNKLNRYSTFIKIMEYMAANKPLVAFDLKETRYSANGSAILIKPGDIVGFAEAIKKLLDEPKLRKELGKAGLERLENELNWENALLNLVEAYRTLSL